jgi:hypothetical protein
LDTGDTFAGVKRPEREPSLRMYGATASFRRMPSWLAQGQRLPFHWRLTLTVIWAVLEDCYSLGYCAVDSGRNIAAFLWSLLPVAWRSIIQHRYTSSAVLMEATGLSETSARFYHTAQQNGNLHIHSNENHTSHSHCTCLRKQ